jgi:eukaryotic-like serine/threonine-protein kinase
VIVGAGVHLGVSSLRIGPSSTLASRGLVTPAEPIVLADFTADVAHSDIARTVTEALRIDLHQSPVLRIAEAHEVAAALVRMGHDPAAGVPASVAREVAVREGQKAVIVGEVGALGGRYILTAKVIAASDGTTLAAFRETARDSTDLIGAVDRLSKTVRREVGESVRALQGAAPLPRVATASLPALRLYADASRNAWSGGDEARTAALLEEAVALDSAFAGAYRSLATVYWNMRADRARIAAATRAAYRLRDRLPERERYLIEAAYHWQLLGDPSRARDAYRRVLALDPHDATARANLALAMLFDGEPVEAERVVREASASGELPVGLRLNLVRALYFQGRTGEALAVVDSITGRPEGSPGAAISRVRILGGDHRWEEAESAARSNLARYGANPQVRAETLRSLWHLALARGRLAAADTLFAELDALLHRIGALDARARATIQRAESRLTLGGHMTEARDEIHRLLRQDDFDIFTAGATLAPRAAAVLAAAGDTATAARLIETWEALPPEERGDPDTFSPELARARIDLAAGRPDAAASRLERASRGTIQAIHYLPDLAIAHDRAGRPDSATAVIDRYLRFRHTRRLHRIPPYIGPVLIRAAELSEEAGDTTAAIDAHARLVEMWSDADADLQPRVEHARQRLAELSTRDS